MSILIVSNDTAKVDWRGTIIRSLKLRNMLQIFFKIPAVASWTLWIEDVQIAGKMVF